VGDAGQATAAGDDGPAVAHMVMSGSVCGLIPIAGVVFYKLSVRKHSNSLRLHSSYMFEYWLCIQLKIHIAYKI